MRSPSGDHVGFESLKLVLVSCRTLLPSAFIDLKEGAINRYELKMVMLEDYEAAGYAHPGTGRPLNEILADYDLQITPDILWEALDIYLQEIERQGPQPASPTDRKRVDVWRVCSAHRPVTADVPRFVAAGANPVEARIPTTEGRRAGAGQGR